MTMITLNEARREDVVAKQAEYRERYERAAAANVQSVMDDAHYKIVAIGILLKEGSVSFAEAMDEVLRSDDAFRHDLMDNAFAAIRAVNTGDMTGLRRVFIDESRPDEVTHVPHQGEAPEKTTWQ
jgi:hypothetical protein